MLDTLENIETPEGVSLSVRPAGLYVRALAKALDFIIELIILIVLVIALLQFGEALAGLMVVAIFLLTWFYNVIFEVWFRGATPGKMVMNLHVVYTNGAPVSLTGSVLRNFLRVVDVLPSLYALGAVVSLGNPRFQRLGDMAAGTVVAYRDDAVTGGSKTKVKQAAPLRLALAREEHKAIAAYGDRADSLSAERRVELAELLGPISGMDGDDAVVALRRHASWLSGHT